MCPEQALKQRNQGDLCCLAGNYILELQVNSKVVKELWIATDTSAILSGFSYVVVVQLLSSVQLFVALWTIKYPTRVLYPWVFPGQNTRLSCHFLLQGIYLAQGSNLHLLHWQMNSLLGICKEEPQGICTGEPPGTLVFNENLLVSLKVESVDGKLREVGM